MITKRIIEKPFLRWAGGKNWLIKHLVDLIPGDFNDYYEPFVGGGSVFFNLPSGHAANLSDLNSDLIDTYLRIKEDVEAVIRIIKSFNNTKEDYYRIRAQKQDDPFFNAAKFIYLNKTSFNGIYRVNRKGEYNVPFGARYTIDYIQEDTLRRASEKLQNATLKCQDFETALKDVKKGDFVFIDPPYTVAHENNGFIAYNQKLFSLEDQYRLNSGLVTLKAKGAYFLMTNAYHRKIKEIYSEAGELSFLERPSLIGGRGAKRETIKEYIIHNLS